jgi:hypothetical protein
MTNVKALETILKIYIAAVVFAAVIGLAVMVLPIKARADEQNGLHVYADIIIDGKLAAVMGYTKVQPFATLEECKTFVQTDSTLHEDTAQLAELAATASDGAPVIIAVRCSTSPVEPDQSEGST